MFVRVKNIKLEQKSAFDTNLKIKLSQILDLKWSVNEDNYKFI